MTQAIRSAATQVDPRTSVQFRMLDRVADRARFSTPKSAPTDIWRVDRAVVIEVTAWRNRSPHEPELAIRAALGASRGS